MGTNLKVTHRIYRDANNALCSRPLVLYGDRLLAPRGIGFVWRDRIWADGVTRYSRCEMVFQIDGQTYRLGKRVATPLVLRDGEKVESMIFHPGACFV